MKKNGAQIATYALEQIGVQFTFGIPGTHTTEIYDAIEKSGKIKPILVAHEGGASFMADAISRTTNAIGCLTIVPAAGLTHALSGIGEAYLDGIPMVVIAGGIRRDSGKYYQLHQLDMQPIAQGVTKAQLLIKSHADIIPTIYEAYQIAISGEPGPVFIEFPVEIMMFSEEVKELPPYNLPTIQPSAIEKNIDEAVNMLLSAKHPMLYLGWGARAASEYTIKIAEKLNAPVALTLQGKSVFPNNHPLYTSCFIGASGKPSSQFALKQHDAMLAVGVRFSEISTGSYGLENPKGLIHIDINNEVFDKNYKSTVNIEGDATAVLKAIWKKIKDKDIKNDNIDIAHKIASLNKKYNDEWLVDKRKDIVSPGWFFDVLNKKLNEEAYVALDDGKHTFLAAELLTSYKANHLISPTDFNCMGYCIPATIATKLAHPDKTVIGIVGDGAAQMTGLELITAKNYEIAPILFVFNDGELGQIAQFQKVPLKDKTCTVIGGFNFEGLAIATGCEYFLMQNDFEIETIIDKALALANGSKPVLVDVRIDYTKKTMLTKGVIKTNLSRFPIGEKIRFITRMLKRHVLG
ncbi:MAG: thiamine pyrophosphate-binding protein [Chitinophagales bacterium]|nr:thiamine pyrophosphate-binding protein [Chitinophagales bacterium]